MKSPNMRRDLLVYLGGTAGICIVVGLLSFLVNGKGFWRGMLYSFCIGVQISLCISLLQAALARVLARWRGDATPELAQGWVGWGWMMPIVLVGTLTGYSGGLWLGDALSGLESTPLWQMSRPRAALTLGFLLLVSMLGALFFVSMFKLHGAKLSQARAEQLAAEARLTLLQSQLEPHMLFNTLAHLRVLIKLRPDEAQQMLDKLIDYLRATLQASRATEHALADEFERVSDYLALMQLRMGERLRVRLELPVELAAIPIPPLLLQPLVENAIKHGLEPHVDGGELRVSAARDGTRLLLEVADSGAGLTQATGLPGSGFGLAQVHERLAQRYGAAASFSLQPQAGGGSVARIEIQT
ncbi:histidine kinase [Roseateles asaccharophilus]|uniref:Signal transduction histidine kinase n=1 Tax=Roseateles asaccharophilus TaxID=582607 RepID=A0ABU2AFS6_9BURK|nr:histidine kinase [Roseateles asaccharophilus]MDR7336076.1 signal transduction histidine kinase [Roseateles asaccharophilus]